MSEEKCKFYKKQFLSKYCELFKQPCYGKHCNFIKEFTRLNELEQQLQAAKEENDTLTQQNKQMREALEKIERYKNNCYMFKVENDTHYIDFKYIWEICNIAQQALKGVE